MTDPNLEEDLADESEVIQDLPEPADPASVPEPEGEEPQ
jgi:hypothetical protein